jgi:23S rRNA U2552 (ribose-2'-O)-methylase RlmE/FtsJ
MSYFLLQKIYYHKEIVDNIQITYAKKDIDIGSNRTLLEYLQNVKSRIDEYPKLWEKYKKITNPFEYIHTPIKRGRSPVCTLTPLSRSFFKMIEIDKLLSITGDMPNKIKTFHLAEGPGGFIEALCLLRNNLDDVYYGMTLQNQIEPSVPGWKKSDDFLLKNPIVKIENGIDGTGDLTHAKNLKYCWDNYHGSMNLVTGDGGFDFSVDFNKQEVSSTFLIFCQVAFAVATQAKGGTFLLKLFDTFTQASLDLLYILSTLYENVYFVKPCTSRSANSEKYVVCKNFRLYNSIGAVKKFYTIMNTCDPTKHIERFLNFPIEKIYSSNIEELNAIYGQQQLEMITLTLSLIEEQNLEKIQKSQKKNIQKCKAWCHNHNMPYNEQQNKCIYNFENDSIT